MVEPASGDHVPPAEIEEFLDWFHIVTLGLVYRSWVILAVVQKKGFSSVRLVSRGERLAVADADR